MDKQEKEQLFAKILEKNRQSIFRICFGYAKEKPEAEDLFQNVIIQIWRNLGSFNGKAKIDTWVYRVTVNTCLTHIRNKKRRDKIISPLKDQLQPASEAVDLEKRKKEEELLNSLKTAIGELPKIDRLLALMLLEGISYQEMAEVTGISLNYVGVKINRIKKKLKKMLQHES